METSQAHEAVVIGASSGGMDAVRTLIKALPAEISLPVMVVQHIPPDATGSLALLLDEQCGVKVKEADEKETIAAGTVYLAPANYHLLVEPDRTLTLTVTEHVNYARPAIDVLFETAADVFGSRLIGIVLTGANSDGARGLEAVKKRGGLTIVQDPDTAFNRAMPEAAIEIARPACVMPLERIGEFLRRLTAEGS